MRNQTGQVENSESPGALVDRSLVVAGHQIVPGDELVIAVRRFNRGLPWIPDQTGYEKLTIALSNIELKLGRTTVIDLEDEPRVVVFHSWGNSSSPRLTGCMGHARSGTLKWELKTPDQLRVDIDVNLETFSPSAWGGCGERRFRLSGMFGRKEIDELTEWDGRPVEEDWRATHPKSELDTRR
jgi:hypothetical protein